MLSPSSRRRRRIGGDEKEGRKGRRTSDRRTIRLHGRDQRLHVQREPLRLAKVLTAVGKGDSADKGACAGETNQSSTGEGWEVRKTYGLRRSKSN